MLTRHIDPHGLPTGLAAGGTSWAALSILAEQACSTLQPQSSDLLGWRFKAAAHSSKMLTKRHRLYRLAGQLAQAREGFAVAPGPCLSGSPPLLMAAARAGRVSQRGSDLIGWRFKTAAHSSKMLTKRHRLYRLAGQWRRQRGLCSRSRAMPERLPASTHGGSASWAREPAWE